MSDLDLLQLYVRDRDDDAFSALVARHIDLVYSAARRQVRATHLAEEVTQSVFTQVAQRPPILAPDQPFSAWLYVVTRRAAIDIVRSEARRRVRETTAAEITAMQTPSESWSKVEATIDDAMAALNDTERTAIVLRFFENKSLRDVGTALGISEDTAQKRVSRALERLRQILSKRAVAASAASLATEISLHAVQAAPAGLAAAISSSTAALPFVAVAAAKQLAMTTAQKILATAAVTIALALALHEGNAAVQLHRQAQDGQQQLDRLADTARQLRLERDAAARQLASLDQGRTAAQAAPEPGSDAALTQEAAAWSARVNQLKQTLVQHPELGIPELQLLTEADWLLATMNRNFSSKEITQALLLLRTRAKDSFTKRVSDEARSYFATAKTWPTQFDQLAPLLTPPVDPAILARYDFQSENGRLIVAEKLAGALDLDRLALCAWEDTKTKRGLSGFYGSETAQGRSVREAVQAYAKVHDGAPATDPAQLWPFLSQSLDAATLAKLFQDLPLPLQPRPATATP